MRCRTAGLLERQLPGRPDHRQHGVRQGRRVGQGLHLPYQASHVLVDASGYFANDTSYEPLSAPQRFYDARPGTAVFDNATGDNARPGRKLTDHVVKIGGRGRSCPPRAACCST
ncbi:MAG: hypothetical protein R2705_24790 [Ilumatobacteraceae bacterium]